ncbi:MAG TPA: hypothetical protein DD670_13675 [Planctomycetaceae bacterium]|nr:hypothetical protein [Planctomycetaceae bacterium]
MKLKARETRNTQEPRRPLPECRLSLRERSGNLASFPRRVTRGRDRARRIGRLPMAFFIGTILLAACESYAQFGSSSTEDRFELSEAVGLDRADSQVGAEFERARAYLADQQWGEAVATLRRVMEQSSDRLWPVTPQRFVTVRDYCHLQLSSLPPPALAVYRAQVDSLARRWYDEGVAGRNASLQRKVVDEAFASSWGDDALLALGELALESGDAAMARAWWQRILPIEPKPASPHGWLAFPDTTLDLAAVRARLVLASILEGSASRAADELEQFARLHPEAEGWLGGCEANYVETLRALMAENASWPPRKPSGDWPTFAGSPTRNHAAPKETDPAGVAWRVDLTAGEPEAGAKQTVLLQPMPADIWSSSGPSLHPIRVGPLVLVNDAYRIWAMRLATGEPAWGNTPVVFSDRLTPTGSWLPGLAGTLGRPRFTMTALDGKLYARMGPPWTDQPRHGRVSTEENYLVCIDLEGEGRLLWKTAAESGGWAFEGSPVSDGRDVYVAMRRGDIRPQTHVACYDARTGRQRWRRFICAAETPSRGLYAEITHNLLTLDHATLYYNTNLGAVAALSTDSGRIQWLSLYPRRRQGNRMRLAAHWGRSLNPGLYDRGVLLVAPADSRRILAFDGLTGQILWQTGTEVEDVVHLLGVADDCLIASGKRLYWIDLKRENQGRVRHVWPATPSLRLQGRGVLAGRRVYLPADDRIYVFDQDSAKLEKIIELQPKGVAGGNLLVADGKLLITTKDGLVALGEDATGGSTPDEESGRQENQLTEHLR